MKGHEAGRRVGAMAAGQDGTFKGRHFTSEVILWALRRYLAFPVSYSDLASMLSDRGVVVGRTTLFRWVQAHAATLEKRVRRHLQSPATRLIGTRRKRTISAQEVRHGRTRDRRNAAGRRQHQSGKRPFSHVMPLRLSARLRNGGFDDRIHDDAFCWLLAENHDYRAALLRLTCSGAPRRVPPCVHCALPCGPRVMTAKATSNSGHVLARGDG